MRENEIALNGTYRVKQSVRESAVGVDGEPLDLDVTIVRVKSTPGYKRLWYFDARGNGYRSTDFEKRTEVIEIEL